MNVTCPRLVTATKSYKSLVDLVLPKLHTKNVERLKQIQRRLSKIDYPNQSYKSLVKMNQTCLP